MVSVVLPTQRLGRLRGCPATALRVRYHRGQAGLMGLMKIGLVAIAVFRLAQVSRDLLPVLGLFGFTLGAAACALVLLEERWTARRSHKSASGT